VKESKPEVGSSRRMRLGFVMSSFAMFVLFRSPPETPLQSGKTIVRRKEKERREDDKERRTSTKDKR
jgi:hypothetical protein